MLPPACCAAGTMGDVLPTVGWLWVPRGGSRRHAVPLSPGQGGAPRGLQEQGAQAVLGVLHCNATLSQGVVLGLQRLVAPRGSRERCPRLWQCPWCCCSTGSGLAEHLPLQPRCHTGCCCGSRCPGWSCTSGYKSLHNPLSCGRGGHQGRGTCCPLPCRDCPWFGSHFPLNW